MLRKKINGESEVLLLHKVKSRTWNHDSWHLPKGVVDGNETEKQTAQREIFEETGFKVRIIKKLGSLESTYEEVGSTKNKKTIYFLCEPILKEGNSDGEHDSVNWVGVDKAAILLSKFPIWEKEEEVIKLIN